jgi:hypothetical protein
MAGREGATGLGIRDGRMSAVAACASHGYRPGTVLSSAAWSADMQIMEVGAKFVTVRRVTASRTDRVRTFPNDVAVVRNG